MLRKVSVALAGLAMLGLAGPAMAQAVNPWAPTQTTVPININVNAMIELFTGTGLVPLQIVDAGENQGSAQAVSRILHRLSNVPVDISAYIDANIPDNTQFHILINPANPAWLTGAGANPVKTLSWRREGGVYIGADGGFANQVSGAGIGSGNSLPAFSAAANAPVACCSAATDTPIQYFADARNVMPAIGSAGFNVVWEIAQSP